MEYLFSKLYFKLNQIIEVLESILFTIIFINFGQCKLWSNSITSESVPVGECGVPLNWSAIKIWAFLLILHETRPYHNAIEFYNWLVELNYEIVRSRSF